MLNSGKFSAAPWESEIFYLSQVACFNQQDKGFDFKFDFDSIPIKFVISIFKNVR